MTFPPNGPTLLIFHSQNQLFPENVNGPYRPYEHILQDILIKIWPKKSVWGKSWKMEGSKNPECWLWGKKKPLRGAPEAENSSENKFGIKKYDAEFELIKYDAKPYFGGQSSIFLI